MLKNKIHLEVLGLTFSQVQAGAYALVLGEAGGLRRIPIIIGQMEAQAIAIELQGLAAPRPLTHDLICQMMKEYRINLREIQIYKLEKDIFYSRIVCRREAEEEHYIDARTSDAIALAVRQGCPIYIDADVFVRVSIVFNPEIGAVENIMPVNALENASLNELQRKLDEAVKEEKYEFAAKVRDEINRRQ